MIVCIFKAFLCLLIRLYRSRAGRGLQLHLQCNVPRLRSCSESGVMETIKLLSSFPSRPNKAVIITALLFTIELLTAN